VINIEYRGIVNWFLLSGALHTVSKPAALAQELIAFGSPSTQHPKQDVVPDLLLSLLP
jgi:hypothetical protein